MDNFLVCVLDFLPSNYLGISVGAYMACNCKPIIDRFHSELLVWKASYLSFSGRVTLIKAFIGSLPTYYFSLFKYLSTVIDDLENIRRRFLWVGHINKKKINWISWDKVLASKDESG